MGVIPAGSLGVGCYCYCLLPLIHRKRSPFPQGKDQVLPAHIYVECSLRYTDKNGAIQNVKERLDLLRKRTKAEWNALMQ